MLKISFLRSRLFLELCAAAVAIIIISAALVYIFRSPQNSYSKNDTDSNKLHIAATIFPIYDLAKSVGGDKVEATLLLSPGTPLAEVDSIYDTLTDFSSQQVVFAVGHGLDDTNVPDELKSKVFIVDQNINLLLEQGSTGSPYYWLSVKQSPAIVANIAKKLSELDPKNADYYKNNGAQLTQQLAGLDATIEKLFAQLSRRQMTVYGYDWAYFAQDYGLDIFYYHPPVASNEFSEEASGELKSALNRFGLSSIFTDIVIPQTPLLSLIDQERFAILGLDVLGGTEDRTSYITTMAYNARTLFEGLSY